jgi:hypothetical protein
MTDSVNVLGLPGGASLSTEQARRVTCLALAVSLMGGRGMSWQSLMTVAQWLYAGEAEG